MSKTTARRNAIIQADEELDEEEFDEGTPSDDSDDDADDYSDEVITDEDVVSMVNDMGEKERTRVQRSRQRGKADTRGRRTGHKTPDKGAHRTRNPQRESQNVWRPADTLDAPKPRAGMEQRWIRFQLGGNHDAKNILKKTREGWKPRELSTVPENYYPPTVKVGDMGEVIGVSDLILCERPATMGQQRRKHYSNLHKRQVAAVERKHVERVERDDHPIDVNVRKERPTVGRGFRKRRAQIQGDE